MRLLKNKMCLKYSELSLIKWRRNFLLNKVNIKEIDACVYWIACTIREYYFVETLLKIFFFSLFFSCAWNRFKVACCWILAHYLSTNAMHSISYLSLSFEALKTWNMTICIRKSIQVSALCVSYMVCYTVVLFSFLNYPITFLVL